MRRDRDGSELEDDDAEDEHRLGVAELRHLVSCVDGWVGEDGRGRPVPCQVCRPHLERLRGRRHRQIYGPWAAA